ncbi:MerR family transcriptional regulator [Streptomyces alkaliphilus]|uniref:MerR family transcriptional regulator n=1 Tax=Streptomyces alkaliphilus TaxID=1472722 RepID=UPI001180ACBD|nr:MerR family transcriptional regulator [Streptomyces alkaliphilus]MQS10129.1 MerR family transcriptional regulator [Streptomyces alkaliphilus]
MGWSVGEVARFAGVSVRTLHHYDAIGLLEPSGRTHAGHRRYEEKDLDRLQRILFHRELGFPLEEIAILVDDPDLDPTDRLRRQHHLLTERIGKLRRMAAAVERAMEARRMGISLTPEERFEVFGRDHDWEAYDREAEERWGDTDAWAESRRRSARYTKEDWQRIKAEDDELNTRIAALVAAGTAPDSPEGMDLAEEHRQRICRRFYPCDHAMHVNLGDMYVADERFTATYERIREGMARWLRDAIRANAARRGPAGD